MRLLFLLAALAVPFAGCQVENRPDGGNPDHSGADDASENPQSATPLATPEDPNAAQEALGDAVPLVPDPLPPTAPPPPPPPVAEPPSDQ